MRKQIAFGIAILVLIIIIVTSLMVPKLRESKIKQEIDKANYCNVDSDCVDAGGKCPFGCYAYVNKDEVNRISDLIGSYNSKCVYGCVSCPTAICENNKCKEVCEE